MFDERPEGTVGTEEASLVRILRELNDEGYFKASVLVSAEGFPMALAASPFDLTKPVFARFENRLSLEVLSLLAKTPISLLGATGRE